MKKLKWNRSKEGHVTTKCGRYWIVPKFCGTARPEDYTCYFYPDKGPRVTVEMLNDTQRECKAACELHNQRRTK